MDNMKPFKTMIFDPYNNSDSQTGRRGRSDISYSLQAQPSLLKMCVNLHMDGKNPSSIIFGPHSRNSGGVRAGVVSAAHKRRPSAHVIICRGERRYVPGGAPVSLVAAAATSSTTQLRTSRRWGSWLAAMSLPFASEALKACGS